MFGQSPGPKRPPGPPPGGPIDGIRILEVLPAALVVDQEQEVFVRVRHDLKSRDTAQLHLGFNTDGPTRFRVFTKEPVGRGEGEAVLSPRDWGELVFFQAFAWLSNPSPPPPRPPPGERPPPVPGKPRSRSTTRRFR